MTITFKSSNRLYDYYIKKCVYCFLMAVVFPDAFHQAIFVARYKGLYSVSNV